MEGQKDSNGNVYFKDLKCVICLKKKSRWIDLNSPSLFKCFTCKSGFVCRDCMDDFDPIGSIFCDTLKDVKKIIKCPCCRVENWNYHFNQIINVTLGYDITDSYLGKNRAIDYYIKQQIRDGYWSIDINGIEVNKNNVDSIDFSSLDGCKYR